MSGVRQALVDFFAEEKWQAHESKELRAFRAGYQGRLGRFVCYAKWNERDDLLTFYAVPEVKVAPERVPWLMELVTRANFGLPLGCFELDVNDGELRYRSGLDAAAAPATVDAVRRLVRASLLTAERYLPAIRSVLDGTRTPKEAIADVERG